MITSWPIKLDMWQADDFPMWLSNHMTWWFPRQHPEGTTCIIHAIDECQSLFRKLVFISESLEKKGSYYQWCYALVHHHHVRFDHSDPGGVHLENVYDIHLLHHGIAWTESITLIGTIQSKQFHILNDVVALRIFKDHDPFFHHHCFFFQLQYVVFLRPF